MKNLIKTLLCALLLVSANTVFAPSSFAASVCPVMTGGVAGGGIGVSIAYAAGSGVTDGGCNVLITFEANGSITTTHPNASPSYDQGADDNLVGIINLTSGAISSVTLSGGIGSTPFGFDGDGACDPTWIFAGGNPCGTPTAGNTYGPEGVTFSGISADHRTGTVNFAGGIDASGGSGWFSLEDPVDLNLVVNAVPEPASILLLGTGLLGIAGIARRRKA